LCAPQNSLVPCIEPSPNYAVNERAHQSTKKKIKVIKQAPWRKQELKKSHESFKTISKNSNKSPCPKIREENYFPISFNEKILSPP